MVQAPGFIRGINPKSQIENPQAPAFIPGVNLKSKISNLKSIDRWYGSSQTCSNCGHVQSRPLKERVFNCQHCGAIIERDLNVAINLARSSELVRPVLPEVTPVDKLRAYSLGRYSSRTLNLP
jgi:hypothetical protein